MSMGYDFGLERSTLADARAEPEGMQQMRLRHLKLAALGIVLLLSSVLAGCETKYVCKDASCQRKHDLASIANFSLKTIEHISPVTTFVVPAKFDALARAALADLRPVIDLESMPSSGDYMQPKGYFLVQTFRLDESGAVFEGRLGPALKTGLPGYEDNCGTTFIIPFELEGKEWASHSYKTHVCSSTNFIVPAAQQ